MQLPPEVQNSAEGSRVLSPTNQGSERLGLNHFFEALEVGGIVTSCWRVWVPNQISSRWRGYDPFASVFGRKRL